MVFCFALFVACLFFYNLYFETNERLLFTANKHTRPLGTRTKGGAVHGGTTRPEEGYDA